MADVEVTVTDAMLEAARGVYNTHVAGDENMWKKIYRAMDAQRRKDSPESDDRLARVKQVIVDTYFNGAAWADIARAAISADRAYQKERGVVEVSREPTEAMLTDVGPMEGFDVVAYEKDCDRPHIEWWQAMIEAAEKETTESP